MASKCFMCGAAISEGILCEKCDKPRRTKPKTESGKTPLPPLAATPPEPERPSPGTEPVPLTPPSEPITGDSHQHLVAPLTALAGELGYSIEIRDLPEDGPGGWCDSRRKQIVVATGPANGQVRTLVHEVAHALGIGYDDYSREQAEVLVDCVTYIVCSSAGLDVGGESIPYIAGWGEDGALDAIREYAQTIDTIARRIEDALEPATDPASDAIAAGDLAA